MKTIKEFLLSEGYKENLINEYIMPENYYSYDLDYCENIYRKNLSFMRKDFDDSFILEMLSRYSGQFMSSSLFSRLSAVKLQFGTDMWATLIQYEFAETGTSTIFDLMDSLVVREFESELKKACEKIRTIWLDSYGDLDL